MELAVYVALVGANPSMQHWLVCEEKIVGEDSPQFPTFLVFL